MVPDARMGTPNGASANPDINAFATGLRRLSDHAVRSNPELVALVMEHDDLDSAIAALAQVSASDDQRVARLKKRKLMLRDRIAAKAAGHCRAGAY
jgi:hypothetical protein